MEKILKIATFLVVAVTITVVFGCASVESRNTNVNIEKIESSPIMRYENVRVTSTDSTITVEGNLHASTRSYVPGHVDITFLSPDDEVLHTFQTDVRRQSLKSRDYHFHAEVPLVLPDESTVGIVYHRRTHN